MAGVPRRRTAPAPPGGERPSRRRCCTGRSFDNGTRTGRALLERHGQVAEFARDLCLPRTVHGSVAGWEPLLRPGGGRGTGFSVGAR